MALTAEDLDVIHLEETLWVATAPIGLPVYDFDFGLFFAGRRARPFDRSVTAVARFGAQPDYERIHRELQALGVELLHSPEVHDLASELPQWYPLLSGLTPRSRVFDAAPGLEVIEAEFGFPFFLKGSRQTSRHRRALSIIRTPEEYRQAVEVYATDPMLHWQRLVAREFVRLRPVAAEMGERIPASFEFRTFWWRGQLVAAGPYFAEFARYRWTEAERAAALAVGETAATRLAAVPFLVVDLAQDCEGRWLVIEVNDAQECGYAGIAPLPLWQRVIELERGRSVRG
ncbi:MAG: ATP-grasp domain-containing protein [Verrucomicrobia bacterium]|nr:ATP-grasp domain-containing protein [Verrucomicrobiota bacterium]